VPSRQQQPGIDLVSRLPLLVGRCCELVGGHCSTVGHGARRELREP
jgi:hypothetical protein